MTDRQFHLFSWKEDGRWPSDTHTSIADLYTNSFSSIKDAQEYFCKNRVSHKEDIAEIVTMQKGEMCIVASGCVWQDGWDKKVSWTLEVEQITNLPKKQTPEPEEVPMPKMPNLAAPTLLAVEPR